METVGRVQDHPRALDSPERQSDRGRPPLKLGSLFLGKLNHIRAAPGHNTSFCTPSPIPSKTPQDLRTRPLAGAPALPDETRETFGYLYTVGDRHIVLAPLPGTITEGGNGLNFELTEGLRLRIAWKAPDERGGA